MTSAPPNGVHSVDRSLEGVPERAVSEDALGSVMLLDHPVSSVAHSPDLSIAPTREHLDTNRGGTLFPDPLHVVRDLDRLLGVHEETEEFETLLFDVKYLDGLDWAGGVVLQFQHFLVILLCVLLRRRKADSPDFKRL